MNNSANTIDVTAQITLEINFETGDALLEMSMDDQLALFVEILKEKIESQGLLGLIVESDWDYEDLGDVIEIEEDADEDGEDKEDTEHDIGN